MFTGEFNHTIDQKGRISIPAKFRTLLGEVFMVTKSLDGNLDVYDKTNWDILVEKLNKLPMTDERARYIKRFLTGGAIEVEPDKVGRVLLNESLIEFAKLEKDIVIVGVGDRIEIWDSKMYKEKNSFDDIEKLSKTMEGLGI